MLQLVCLAYPYGGLLISIFSLNQGLILVQADHKPNSFSYRSN